MKDPINPEAMTHTEYLKMLAEKGDTRAMDDLVEAGHLQAWAALEDLAEAGHLQAMAALAVGYEKGEVVEKDLEKSQYWYDRLHAVLLERANKGDPQAMWNLAYAYRHGHGVKKDYAKSQEWRNKYDNTKEQEQD